MLAALVGLAAAGTAVSGASAASAATTAESIEVSADGITYDTTFPGSLFGETRLIPGSSVAATLWVRNPTSAEAYLRVVLTDVVANDVHYWGALSMLLTVSGETVTSPMTASDECTVLVMAVPMAAGEALPVSLALALGDLNGTQGQNGRADFALGVTLSEVAYPTDECAPPAVEVPGTPGAPSVFGPHIVAKAASGYPVGYASADFFARGWNSPFRGFLIDFNTGRLDDRFLILLVGTTLGLGAGWLTSLVRGRKRAAARAKAGSTPHNSRRYTTHTTRHTTAPGGTR